MTKKLSNVVWKEDEFKDKLHLIVVKGCNKGIWIGQFREFPGVLVQSTSKEGLRKEAVESLKFYIDEFANEIIVLTPGKVTVA